MNTRKLLGWSLTDHEGVPGRWVFPSVVLGPGERLVVFASGKDTDNYVDAEGHLHTTFKLSSGGEYLALVAPDGTVFYPWQLGHTIQDASGNPLADNAQPPGTTVQPVMPITPINR